jgi:hypothetical protein
MASSAGRLGALLRGVVLVGLLVVSACSDKTAGLEVVIATSGLQLGVDFDAIEGVVEWQTPAGSWKKVLEPPALVPSEITLPTTLGVGPGTSGDQEALITVSALKNGAPVVQRVVQLQIPTDRVAQLLMILSADCLDKLGLCPAGESPQPSTPMCPCGANYVNPNTLPTYPSPWDAGPSPDGGSTESPNATVAEGGGAPNDANGASTDIGSEATNVVAPSADVSGDASGPDASLVPDANTDTGADAALPPSCAPGGPGMTNCGPGGSGTESCCTSLEVEGGTYYRTFSWDPDAGAVGEADPATVSNFRLDKYLVTVGRFRQFVNAVLPPDGGAGWVPEAGSGTHSYLNGGLGLANASGDAGVAHETGWQASDDVFSSPWLQTLFVRATRRGPPEVGIKLPPHKAKDGEIDPAAHVLVRTAVASDLRLSGDGSSRLAPLRAVTILFGWSIF